MKRNCLHLAASAGVAALLCGASPASAQTAPSLGSSQSFAVLGGSGVTVAGAAVTTISGDVGSSPTPSITGFPPGQVAPGFTLYTTNAVPVQDAQGVNTAAYLNLSGQGCTSIIAGGILGGLTLGPGVHCVVGSVADLTGTLTLNGAGVYIFKATSSLVTAGASNVALINGADSCNVYWQVTSSATLGSASTFRGNIFALASITVGTTANVIGRTWAQTGAVTMNGGNTVGGCAALPPVSPVITLSPATLPNGTVGVAYSQTITGSGGTAPYTFGVTAGTLPAGLTLTPAGVLAGTPTTTGTSTFTIRGTDANGFFAERSFTILIAAAVPTLPQAFVVLLALGLIAVGYFRLRRRRARAE